MFFKLFDVVFLKRVQTGLRLVLLDWNYIISFKVSILQLLMKNNFLIENRE